MTTGLREMGEFDVTMERAAKETGLSLREFYARVTQNVELAKKILILALGTVFRLTAKMDREITSWTCEKPVAVEGGQEFTPELYEFLPNGKTCVTGEEMILLADQRVLTGLRHAEAMLREPEKIPVEWQKFTLFFPEVWQDSDSVRFVWCIHLRGHHGWCLDYFWLGLKFGSDCRLVASSKVASPKPRWHEEDGVIYFDITSNGLGGSHWIRRLERSNVLISKWAEGILNSPGFMGSNGVKYSIAVIKGKSFKDDARNSDIRAEASLRNFQTPNAEIACLIREAFSNGELKEMGLSSITVFHEPIRNPLEPGLLEHHKRLLNVSRSDDGRQVLNARDGSSGSPCQFPGVTGFAFLVPEASS